MLRQERRHALEALKKGDEAAARGILRCVNELEDRVGIARTTFEELQRLANSAKELEQFSSASVTEDAVSEYRRLRGDA